MVADDQPRSVVDCANEFPSRFHDSAKCNRRGLFICRLYQDSASNADSALNKVTEYKDRTGRSGRKVRRSKALKIT